MRRLFGLVVMLAALAMAPATAQASILPGQTIDGPSADIKEFGNIDVAPDGTGALVYRKNVGLNHAIFVSRIANGSFGAPERVDVPPTTNVASRPRVAASNGGRLVVVWLGAAGMGTPFVRGAVSAGSGQPFEVANVPPGAAYISADVDANPSGGTYMTGTQNVNGGDVHTFRLAGTTWTPVGAGPLDATPALKAGGSMAQDQPRITVTNDGNAVVAWPEGDDGNQKTVFARRLTGTSVGPVITATIPTLSGANRANTAFMVDIDSDGADTAWVAFREDFTYTATDRARVLARRLVGGAFETAQVVDPLPLTGPTNGAEDPSLAVNDAGRGLVTTRGQLTAEGNGAALAGGTWSQVGRLDLAPSDNVPIARTAIGDNGAGLFLIAHRPTNASPFTAQARTYVNGQLGPIVPVNDTALGSIAEGLELAADANGNGYVGYMQSADAGTTNRIAAAIVDGPPPVQQPGPGPGPGGGGGGGPTGPTPDTDVPHVTGTKLIPNKFAVGTGTPQSLNPAAVRLGTTIRFVVSEDSRVKFVFERPTVGRRAGSRCVKTTRRNRKARRCTLWVSDGTFTLARKVGQNNVRFSGRLSARRKLRLGKHRVTLTPTDAAGNRGPFQRRPFTLVKRR